MLPRLWLVGVVIAWVGCECAKEPPRRFACFTNTCPPPLFCVETDAGPTCLVPDAGPVDGVTDAGPPDGLDSGAADSGGLDDAGVLDAGVLDAGVLDAGMLDGGFADSGTDAGRDAGPDLRLSFSTLPPVAADSCQALTLTANQMGTSDLDIGVLAAVPSDVRLYSNALCTAPTASIRLLAGSTMTTLYVKPLVGGVVRVLGDAGIATAETSITATPMVRRDTCVMAIDGGTSRDCTFMPPVQNLAHSFVLFSAQTLGGALPLGAGQVSCRLVNLNTVACARSSAAVAVEVSFQVVEVPVGLRVVRLAPTFCDTRGFGELDASVEPTRSFVLKSNWTSSTWFDETDSPLVALDSGVRLESGTPYCGRVEAQVVELSDARVDRGVVGGNRGPFATATLPAGSANSLVLAQPQATNDVQADMCALMVRASLPSTTSVGFSRNLGNSSAPGACTLDYFPRVYFERVDFGSRANVQALTVRADAGVKLVTSMLREVVPSRTFVVTSSQQVSGHHNGETTGLGGLRFTPGVASFALSRNELTMRREDDTAAGAFTVYVVEFNP